MLKKILILYLFLIQVSCASVQLGAKFTSDAAPPKNGEALVYILRPDNKYNSVISPGVVLDDKEIFLLANEGYSYVYLKEGEHNLGIKLSDSYKGNKSLRFSVKNKDVLYYVMKTEYLVGPEKYYRKFWFEKAPYDVGKKLIKDCYYIDPKTSPKFQNNILLDN